MAYTLYYTANFKNEQNQDIEVDIAKKDGASQTVANYSVYAMTITDSSDEQDTYACVITKTLDLTLWSDVDDEITWDTFISATHDEWKVTVRVNGEIYFVGFILPDEGKAPLQDKPFEIVIKATDGIGLLKGFELTKADGTKFEGFNYMIDYLNAMLHKTGLDLQMRIYCSIFYAGMYNKGDGLNYDLFNQAKLNARTFMKDAVEFYDCYEALKILLGGWANIQQHNGKWQICTLSERQYVPQNRYFVDYGTNGIAYNGEIDGEGDALVGRNELIYPINENQSISATFANKTVRYEYKYVMPDLYVNNQKLESLGTLVISGTFQLDGKYIDFNTYRNVGWTMYKGQPYPPTDEQTSSANQYIRVETYKDFNKEFQRYLIVERDLSATLLTNSRNYIKNNNQDFFVKAGDRISISVTFRTKLDESANAWLRMGRLMLLKDGADGTYQSGWYSLQNSFTTEGVGYFNNASETYFAEYATSNDTTQWKTAEIKDAIVPVDGKCFLTLATGAMDISNNEAHFKDIKIEVTPNMNGANFSMKGDFHQIDQTNNFPDKYTKEMKISESPNRFVKGALHFNNNVCGDLFYRHPNTSERFGFKQLAAIGKFNHSRRRFYKIEGQYRSFVYNISANQNLRKLIGFHKIFTIPGLGTLRKFVLIPSLETDLVGGNIKATFVEIKYFNNDGSTNGFVEKRGYVY